jgi:peptidyl-prolyl cis-trans isomerase C
MTKIVARIALLGAFPFATLGCDGFAQAVTSHTDVLARAAGHELTAEEAASLIAKHEQIPARADIVEVVANIWVDFTLLATAAAQDSTLRNLDVDLLLRPMLQQQLVWKLREKVIPADSTVTDEELRAQFEQDQPGMQVRARHILLRTPPDATPAQRDSVLTLARQIRERAVGGEDFAALAAQYGQDGTAQSGGDLGFFTRDQMVTPFADAAFALQPGQIGDVVETNFGYHVVKVEERKTPNFDEMKDSYRATYQQERESKREQDYIEGLTEPLGIAVQEGAPANARELAANPSIQLRGRAAGRALVRYDGGSFTAANLLDRIRTWNQQQLGQFAAGSDDQVEQILEGLTREKILIEEAEEQGLSVSEAEQDSARSAIQDQLSFAARSVGLTSIQPQDGEAMSEAIERRVNSYLDAVMRNEQQLIPLGVIGFALREQFGGEVFDRVADAVVARIQEIRPAVPTTPAPPPQTPVPDTSGAGS